MHKINIRNNIKKIGIVCLAFLFVGLAVTPALSGQATEAGNKQTFVTIGFCNQIVKKIPKAEWKETSKELWKCPTVKDKISFLHENGLIPVTYSNLVKLANNREVRIPWLFSRLFMRGTADDEESGLIIGNMTDISFNFTGITLGIGLNSITRRIGASIPPLGLELATVHLGEIRSDHLTIGEEDYDPGDYMGGMAGYIGFWAGDSMEGRYFSYENLTVVGFTIFTAWMDLESLGGS